MGLNGQLSNPQVLNGTLSNQILRGYSAYQIAVMLGFEGTEAEWIESLRGGGQVESGGYYTLDIINKNEDTIIISFIPSEPNMDAIPPKEISLPRGKDGTDGKNGSDGVGILSIEQTTTSTEDGGENVVTVTLTDGQKSTFTVRNGSKGNPGTGGGGDIDLSGYATKEEVEELEQEIDDLNVDLAYVSKFEYQYLNADSAESNKFYIGFNNYAETEHNTYFLYPVVFLPIGKYYLRKVSDVFTYLEDGTKLVDYVGYSSSESTLELTEPKKIAVTGYRSADDYTSISTKRIDSYKYGILSVEITGDNLSKRLKAIENERFVTTTLTVGVDKDFATITEAVNSITDSNSRNVYNILIDDGTYNEYGITLPDYVNLIGVSGNREKCVIQGELPDTATTDEITVNSTINLMYSNRLENLTITAKNLRYPIHSESGGNVTDWVQVLSNCYVEHFGNTSPNSTWTSYHAWGEGASSGAYAEFNNCVFKGDLGAWYVHEPTNMPSVNPKPYHHVLNNCEIINNRISTTPYWNGAVAIDNTTDKGVISTIEFNNCNFGNGQVSVSGEYDINVGIHGCNNVPVTRSDASQHNYPNTDYTTIKTYVGTEKISKNTVLMYADGINLVKKATSSTSAEMIAGVATEDCEPNNFVKIIKGTYVSKTGNVGQKVYCDDNGQLADAGTIVIGTCYGQFSLIN